MVLVPEPGKNKGNLDNGDLNFCKKGQVCWYSFFVNDCYDVSNCPSEDTVRATSEEVRFQIWEAPRNEHGECSTECTFSACGTALGVPCCVKEDGTSSLEQMSSLLMNFHLST